MLSQVLVAEVPEDRDPDELRQMLVDDGRRSDDVIVLSGRAGLDELLCHDRTDGRRSRIAHLVRHIEASDSSGTGHVLRSAEITLQAGGSVIVLRQVDRGVAARLTTLLHHLGVDAVRYIGRWTVADHGAPLAAAHAGR